MYHTKKKYPVPASTIREELYVENSHFIATLTPVFTVGQAKAFLAEIKQEFPDADHNVSAYIIGGGNSRTEYCSDDGEPTGTAGRPALAVLQGSNLGDVALVITRYFGGTKLGKGGLVRAYTRAAQLVTRATARVVKIDISTVLVAIPYNRFEAVRLLVSRYGGLIRDEIFGTDILLTIQFRQEQLSVFQSALLEITAGTIQAVWVSDGEEFIPWDDNPVQSG